MRHNLPMIRVLDDDGTMNEQARKVRRVWIATKLPQGDRGRSGRLRRCLSRSKTHDAQRGHLLPLRHRRSSRSSSEQWFVKMKPLAEPAIEVVRRRRTVRFVPERFAKMYFNWMENIHDWCISRQLWWGHQHSGVLLRRLRRDDRCTEAPDITVCPKCGGTHMHQDEDVLDTWFSSALWPFSTLGWPEQTEDLDYFYPTSSARDRATISSSSGWRG